MNAPTESNKSKCYYCGRDRHPNTSSQFGWRDNCPAKNATCKEFKNIGHFTNMPACKYKKVHCIKIEFVNCAKYSNTVDMIAKGPKQGVQIKLEADTGANITVLKAIIMEDLDLVNMEPTNLHIQGYCETPEPCLGKAFINLQRSNRWRKKSPFLASKLLPTFYPEMHAWNLELYQKDFPVLRLML